MAAFSRDPHESSMVRVLALDSLTLDPVAVTDPVLNTKETSFYLDAHCAGAGSFVSHYGGGPVFE